MTDEANKRQLERFCAEFLRRLREAPDGTKVFMRCDMVNGPSLSGDANRDDPSEPDDRGAKVRRKRLRPGNQLH